jgi:hypothetical protein
MGKSQISVPGGPSRNLPRPSPQFIEGLQPRTKTLSSQVGTGGYRQFEDTAFHVFSIPHTDRDARENSDQPQKVVYRINLPSSCRKPLKRNSELPLRNRMKRFERNRKLRRRSSSFARGPRPLKCACNTSTTASRHRQLNDAHLFRQGDSRPESRKP